MVRHETTETLWPLFHPELPRSIGPPPHDDGVLLGAVGVVSDRRDEDD